jgi:uncharacterized membrane protein
MTEINLLKFLPSIIGYVLCAFAIIHAMKTSKKNRWQSVLLLIMLFVYGASLEFLGIVTGNYVYAPEVVMIFGIFPLSITLAWVGIIYSVMKIAERLNLPSWLRILTTTLIALSLDWGMDPMAVQLGLWTWTIKGPYYDIPGFNFIGWFFIPIAFLFAYTLHYERSSKRLKILTTSEIEEHDSVYRKLFTLIGVVPISIMILMVVGMVTRIPIVYNPPLIILIIWLFFTIISASGIIIWRRNNLRRTSWIDLIPPATLLAIAYNYMIFGFIIIRPDLAILMILTSIPILLILAFTLFKRKGSQQD